VDVHPFARHNDVLLAAFEIQVAVPVERAQVSGAEPAVLCEYRLQLLILPVPSGDIGAAHQDFAILVELHFAAFQHLADGALAGMERGVQRNQRRGFRQSVALDDHKTQPPPEFFRLAVEGRASCEASNCLGNQSDFPAASTSRSNFSFSDSMIRGPATPTDTRSFLMV